MSEIPRDVRISARKSVGNSGASLWENYYEVCDIAARAILAERERCARIADEVAADAYGDEGNGVSARSIEVTASVIAAAIRKGTTT